MTSVPGPTVAIHLPQELVAKMDDLKQDREQDRNQSVDQIVQRLCQEYVSVCEMSRNELARIDEINRSYEDHPSDWDDSEIWEAHYREMEEGLK
jgi:hypothetical protein